MDNFINFGSYTLNTFHSAGINTTDSLNIFHHNSRSILTEGRLDEYDITLTDINNPFHILAFTETWLKPENAHTAEFAGYEHSHLLRNTDDANLQEGGGGISVYIKEGIKYKIRPELNVALS